MEESLNFEADEPLTLKQVAHALTCSERQVYRLVEKGFLSKPRRMAGRPRWHKRDVATYLHKFWRGDFEGLDDEHDPDDPEERPEKIAPKSDRGGTKSASGGPNADK